MNYNHLFYFWNIAREGSVKNASYKLNLTQPTLSDQLKTFEDSIGEKLFDRTGRRLVLNQRGRWVYEYANRMFRIGGELEEMLLQKETIPTRTLSVGFVPTIAKERIYQILLPFLGHRDFTIKVYEGEFEFIYKAFERDELDMIICENPVYQLSESCLLFKLVASQFFMVCAPELAYLKDEFPRHLSRAPFLNYTSRSGIQQQIFEHFHTHAIHPRIIGEVDDVNIIRRFTMNGHCFSILPNSVVREAISEGRLLSLTKMEDIKIIIHAVIRNTSKNKPIKEILQRIF